MSGLVPSLGLGLLAAVVTAALCPLLPGLLRRAHLLDAPGDRSSHTVPTPRGGGLAVLAGAVVAAVAALALGPAVPVLAGGWVPALAAVGVAAGLIGLVDDARGLPPGLRAVLQLLVGTGAGLLVVALDGVSWVWVPVAAVALAAYVNAVNFMDGLNTVTGLHAVVTGVAFAVMGVVADATGPADTEWLLPAGLVVAGVGLGFLPFNGLSGGPARLFLGDVGSYGLGAMIAFLAGAGFLTGLPLEMALAPLVVWLADTAHTLVLRMAAGERWYLPHRTHAYQRLTDAGWSHRQVGVAAAGATALAAVVATLVAQDALVWRLVGAVALVLLGWAWVKLPAWLGHPSPWGAVARARRG
ncbi:UDP-phosphate glycosyltransferase [Aquipuribacter nitratireducens]|uniref:UDP-phosphate glycosyltransferase n=1 Tax=Aquipuribacter nitratireducens TaxID=650104 RepID=A0ABW0GIP2_9MICO